MKRRIIFWVSIILIQAIKFIIIDHTHLPLQLWGMIGIIEGLAYVYFYVEYIYYQ